MFLHASLISEEPSVGFYFVLDITPKKYLIEEGVYLCQRKKEKIRVALFSEPGV